MLIARSGIVGKSLFIGGNVNAIFAGYLIRFKVDDAQLYPKYVFIFTQLQVYWKWIEATQRLTCQPNINAEEYGRLELPKPPKPVQRDIIHRYEVALELFNRKILEANELLSSIDEYLLSELGIELPPEPDSTIANRMFHTNVHEIGGWRLDPHALKPDIEVCREKTLAFGNALPLRRLVNFIRLRSSSRTEDHPYIGVENVQSDTGLLIDPKCNNEFGTASIFEAGDVLFSKLNPYLNKVFFAKNTGYCSTEFHVLRAYGISPEFLSRCNYSPPLKRAITGVFN